jgi:hypothetical protein
MSNKTTRITAAELSTFAAQAKQRALETREAVELTQEELDQISGGFAYSNIYIAGKIPPFQLLQGFNNSLTLPALNVQGAAL